MGQSEYNEVKIELLARNSTELKIFLLKLDLLKEKGSILRNCSSPSTTWVPGIEIRPSDCGEAPLPAEPFCFSLGTLFLYKHYLLMKWAEHTDHHFLNRVQYKTCFKRRWWVTEKGTWNMHMVMYVNLKYKYMSTIIFIVTPSEKLKQESLAE